MLKDSARIRDWKADLSGIRVRATVTGGGDGEGQSKVWFNHPSHPRLQDALGPHMADREVRVVMS